MARYDLARFRREHCLTQKQLAEALSVTQGFLSSVENGRTPFPEERRKDFEKAFPGVNLNDYRSLDDVAEEVKDWEPHQRRGFLAQIHQTINQLFSAYEDEDDIDDDKTTDSEAGIGFGGMRQPHVTPTDEAALTSDENVPENWRKEVSKVLTENRELDNYVQQLKLEKEGLQSKNDELRDKLHDARKEIFDLQNEVLRLKAILIEHHITEI